MKRILLIRTCAVVTLLFGLNYIIWRWFFSLNITTYNEPLELVIATTKAAEELEEPTTTCKGRKPQ